MTPPIASSVSGVRVTSPPSAVDAEAGAGAVAVTAGAGALADSEAPGHQPSCGVALIAVFAGSAAGAGVSMGGCSAGASTGPNVTPLRYGSRAKKAWKFNTAIGAPTMTKNG